MPTIAIAAHGCPVGAIGPYGNEFTVTTHLDRLAAEGIVYDRHYAEVPDPAGACRIWWNPEALAAFPHRVLVRCTRDTQLVEAFHIVHHVRTFDELIELLPGILDALPTDGLLWIEFDSLIPPWVVPANLFELYIEDLIEEDAEEAEPIEPWSDPPIGWFDRDDAASWELLHRSFAAAMTAFDAGLGRMFELFRERKLDEIATWAFTGSFGWPLGEHGILGPFRAWLYEEFVHVPMIIRRPAAAEAGLRFSGFTQHADFWNILNSVEVKRDAVVSRWAVGESEEAAIRTDEFALLLPLRTPEDEPRPPELYLKPGDRWEANNVQPRQIETAERLEEELRKQISKS